METLLQFAQIVSVVWTLDAAPSCGIRFVTDDFKRRWLFALHTVLPLFSFVLGLVLSFVLSFVEDNGNT